MLDDRERQEMLADGKDIRRREAFRLARSKKKRPLSFDKYLTFLNNIQKIFSPFEISHRITPAKFNKL